MRYVADFFVGGLGGLCCYLIKQAVIWISQHRRKQKLKRINPRLYRHLYPDDN